MIGGPCPAVEQKIFELLLQVRAKIKYTTYQRFEYVPTLYIKNINEFKLKFYLLFKLKYYKKSKKKYQNNV